MKPEIEARIRKKYNGRIVEPTLGVQDVFKRFSDMGLSSFLVRGLSAFKALGPARNEDVDIVVDKERSQLLLVADDESVTSLNVRGRFDLGNISDLIRNETGFNEVRVAHVCDCDARAVDSLLF